MNKYLIVIEKSKTGFSSYSPDIPGCIATGRTKKEVEKNLTEWMCTELTYTSNAIEGNTLTRQETSLVITKGITIAGKSINEHLEAVNHAKAFEWVVQESQVHSPVTESLIKKLHRFILTGIDTDNAGVYRNVPVRISGSSVVMPNYLKIPELMKILIENREKSITQHPVIQAADIHYELVSIHPFIDGNGRSARLLMNYILMTHGYPPALIDPSERITYLNALEEAQLGGSKEAYDLFIQKTVLKSLDNYLEFLIS